MDVFRRRALAQLMRGADEIGKLIGLIIIAVQDPAGEGFRLILEGPLDLLNGDALELAVTYLVLEKSTAEHFSIRAWVRWAGQTRGLFEDFYQTDAIDPQHVQALETWKFKLSYENSLHQLFGFTQPRPLRKLYVSEYDDKLRQRSGMSLERGPNHQLYMGHNSDRSMSIYKDGLLLPEGGAQYTSIELNSVAASGTGASAKTYLLKVEEIGMGSLVDCSIIKTPGNYEIRFRDQDGWILNIQAEFEEEE